MLILLLGLLAGCGASSLNSEGEEAPSGQDTAYTGTSNSRAAVASMAEAYSASNISGSANYRIGSLDVVEVAVFQVPELSKTLQVSEAGMINYPLIGEVPVSGKSPREVEQTLTKILGAKYLKDPQVTVLVKEYNSQRVTVQGSVAKQGIFPIQGRLSLLQVMALSGGLDGVADDTIVIFRTVDGRKSAARFNFYQVQSGAIPDPQLQAGDIIVVGKSAFKEGINNVMRYLPLAAVFTWI